MWIPCPPLGCPICRWTAASSSCYMSHQDLGVSRRAWRTDFEDMWGVQAKVLIGDACWLLCRGLAPLYQLFCCCVCSYRRFLLESFVSCHRTRCWRNSHQDGRLGILRHVFCACHYIWPQTIAFVSFFIVKLWAATNACNAMHIPYKRKC